MPEPITPTRIIPPGSPLPARAFEPAPAAPPAPPVPPPWAPAPPAEPAEVVVRHVHEFVLTPETPELTWRDRVRVLLRHFGRPWQALLGLTLAVIPIPPGDYSLATTWWWCVAQTRHAHGALAAYGLGLGALTMAATLLTRKPSVTRLTLLAVTGIGALGAVALLDPVTILTGVS